MPDGRTIVPTHRAAVPRPLSSRGQEIKISSDSSPRRRTAIDERSATPALDEAYRQVVRAAAGAEHLRQLTERCLARVDALGSEAAEHASGAPLQGRELHRVAGATAAVGLPSLAAALRALEEAYERPGSPELLSVLWDRCRAAALAVRAALSAEGF
jgi:HPt (histidine-containing phosphotransfer) domain-containing protein